MHNNMATFICPDEKTLVVLTSDQYFDVRRELQKRGVEITISPISAYGAKILDFPSSYIVYKVRFIKKIDWQADDNDY